MGQRTGLSSIWLTDFILTRETNPESWTGMTLAETNWPSSAGLIGSGNLTNKEEKEEEEEVLRSNLVELGRCVQR